MCTGYLDVTELPGGLISRVKFILDRAVLTTLRSITAGTTIMANLSRVESINAVSQYKYQNQVPANRHRRQRAGLGEVRWCRSRAALARISCRVGQRRAERRSLPVRYETVNKRQKNWRLNVEV